jgi:AraC-like DNA-binding protein
MELRSSDPSCVVIREVAAGWGYLNASSFNRKFRTFFGVSPSSVLGTGYVEEKVAQTRQKGTRKAHHYNKFQHWLEEASGLNETDSAESQSIPR